MATDGLALVHIPPATVELKVVVPPTQAVVVPLNTPGVNPPLMVTVLLAVASGQPPVPVNV